MKFWMCCRELHCYLCIPFHTSWSEVASQRLPRISDEASHIGKASESHWPRNTLFSWHSGPTLCFYCVCTFSTLRDVKCLTTLL